MLDFVFTDYRGLLTISLSIVWHIQDYVIGFHRLFQLSCDYQTYYSRNIQIALLKSSVKPCLETLRLAFRS